MFDSTKEVAEGTLKSTPLFHILNDRYSIFNSRCCTHTMGRRADTIKAPCSEISVLREGVYENVPFRNSRSFFFCMRMFRKS